MDLVTVIIPTYKRSDIIERTIKSVINQTYKNIEIIVVDDNANFLDERSKTAEIVNKYPKIKLIENGENLGGALTRNVGIENAKGKYIAFLDDDDEFMNDKIEKQLKLLKEKEKEGKKVGMIYCYKKQIGADGKVVFGRKRNFEGNCLFEHMKYFIEPTSTWLCTKEALEEVGKFENVKAHQDYILLMKILASGYEIYRVPEVLLNFYLHNGEGITNKNKNYIEYTKVLIEYKRKYYNLLSEKQVKEVEYVNSCRLLKLYKKNNMKKEYKNELKKIMKSGVINNTIKIISQLYF